MDAGRDVLHPDCRGPDFAALDEWDAETRQEIVNHEILHRLKNTLSIVQSLAHQGFRSVDDQGPLTTFTSRLVALSAAHDLLMRRNWQSTDLASLVRGAHAAGRGEQGSGLGAVSQAGSGYGDVFFDAAA